MVPAAGPMLPPPPPGRRRRIWPWWLASGVFVSLAAAVFGAFHYHVPYYEFHPGSARPTEPLVLVDGVETYESDGIVSFTTVSLRASTLGSRVLAYFDDDVEVVDESVVLGDQTPSENRSFNQQLMDTSKQDAIRNALVALGYDVPITITGIVVVAIEPGSAADGALALGDTIVSVNGEALDEAGDITRIMTGKAPGDTVTLVVEPPDRSASRTIDVVLTAAPDDAGRGIIGVSLQPREPNYEFPFAIDIDTGNVGGPSAGLAFTLGVLDVLTPGSLTGGQRVAVTGTIDTAGNVGPVGGVPQKAAVVADNDYDVFLVPSSEADQVRARTGDDVQVIPVDTLSEALDALESIGGSGLGTDTGP